MEFKKAFISELKPAKYNPRKDLHPNDPEYQKIKKSIEDFGYVDPVIVNSDYTVIGGHQRLKVLKEMGQAQIDVVVVDIPKNKEKALNVALNKIAGEWDDAKLLDLLQEIKLDGLLDVTGFDDKVFEGMMRDLGNDNALVIVPPTNPPQDLPSQVHSPEFSAPHVTDADIQSTGQKLEQITHALPKRIKVICPECGHEFEADT